MEFTFFKYQGTGNDFILVDNRDKKLQLSTAQITLICNRHFGVGGDGLMLLENEEGFDFKMVYYNANGKESSMCGNGGRCLVAFANKLGITGETARFMAADGEHSARIESDGTISLQMQDVSHIEDFNGYSILNTGSPHIVIWSKDVKHIDVVKEGRLVRNQPEYLPDGINVNFVEQVEGGLYVRTYERGVEDETLSCGTGVTACAIAAAETISGSVSTNIYTPGGTLQVSFETGVVSVATKVVLRGPAILVFQGIYNI